MKSVWKLAIAVGAVALLLPLGVALRGPAPLVEQAKGRPFVPVVEEQQAGDDLAREIALRDARVTAGLGNGRWEFVDTLPMSGYLPGALSACAGQRCRQAEFFDYTNNTLIVATVDLDRRTVVQVDVTPGAIPEANRAITERAQAIALADPLVQGEIGGATIISNMAPENAWLRNSSCETPHWCIALTYRVSDRPAGTLVVFVDLNLQQVAGVRWALAPAVPEQNLPVYNTPDYVCGDQLSYSANGWNISYEVQGNDALHVYNVTYNGRPVFRSAKMVQVDVGYANQSWGYHDSVGCSAIVPAYPANTPPVITPTSDGFIVTQDFRMGGWGGGCAYRYQQWFYFYNDGRVRVSAAAFGRGCSNDGVYTPYIRVDLGPGGETGNRFEYRDDTSAWVPATVEGDFQQPGSPFVGGGLTEWRVIGADNQGFELEPRWGLNYEPGQPDNSHVIGLVYHSGTEGDQPNLPSMGSGYGCPNNCFPRQWATNESLQGSDVVLWYVASAQTIPTSPYYCWTLNQQSTYPCYMGPMYHPVDLSGITPTPTLEPSPTPTGTVIPPTPTDTPVPPTPTDTPVPPTPTATPTATPGAVVRMMLGPLWWNVSGP